MSSPRTTRSHRSREPQPRWDITDMGRAMRAYVEANATNVRQRADGVTCEAFHRAGDNPEALRVWDRTGTWADARRDVGGGAKEFAREVAGTSLPEFMAQWGRDPACAVPPRAKMTRAPDYPDAATVARAWGACVPLEQVTDVAAYVRSRGMDVARLVDLDIARALPTVPACPDWMWTGGGSWAQTDHRLVVQLVDANGVTRALHGRAIRPEVKPKTLSPTGHTIRGLVMACPLARRLLAGDADACGFVVETCRIRRASGMGAGVVVAEGLADFLAWAQSASDADELAPAIISVMSGSWTEGLAARLPDGVSVCIATDQDETGERYAARIVETLSTRARSGTLEVLR